MTPYRRYLLTLIYGIQIRENQKGHDNPAVTARDVAHELPGPQRASSIQRTMRDLAKLNYLTVARDRRGRHGALMYRTTEAGRNEI